MNINGLSTELKRSRENLMQSQKEVREYKHLYLASNKEQKFLMDQLENEKKNRELTIQENVKLKADLDDLREKLKQKNKHRKAWPDIKDHKTKKRRISEYKSVIESNILRNIPECTRANLTLSIEGKNMNIGFTSNDLARLHMGNNSQRSSSEHNYSSDKRQAANVRPPETNNTTSAIYDGDGKFLTKHKSRMIYVMDKFRISHQAYHELYMHSRGQLPPISQIKTEKKRMSEVIPYYMHPDVSTNQS